MKRVAGLPAVAGLAVGLVLSTVAGTTTATATVSAGSAVAAGVVTTSAPAMADGVRYQPRKCFAREIVHPGDADTSVHHIEHVRKLQYRLRWTGIYRGAITGWYGEPLTRAVKRFQKRNGLRRPATPNSRPGPSRSPGRSGREMPSPDAARCAEPPGTPATTVPPTR